MKQAVILAGGKGTRLASVLGDLPKPLVDIGGKPLLEHQLDLLCEHGYSEVVLMVNHKVERVRAWLDGVRHPLVVRLIDDGEPRGTAGAVLAALPELADEFLVLYGDTMLGVDLVRFETWHRADPGTDVSIFLHPNDHPHDSDLVEVDEAGRILALHPYPHADGAWLPNLVNAALYLVRRESLKPWASARPPLDFAKDLFPQMLAAGRKLRGYNSPEYIKDAGTPARLERVRQAHATGAIGRASLDHPQKAVFLDRDGTLNREQGLIRRPEDLHVFPFAGPAIKRLNASEWRTVLVSNQPVVARGETSETELRTIHARLETEIARDHAFLDRIYVCPHHIDRGFPGERAELKFDCDCRKPKPGMIFAAQRDLNIDLAASWFVGDSTADLGAAERAGVSSILVDTGHGGRDNRHPFEPDFRARDLAEAVSFILDVYPALSARLQPLVDGIEAGQDCFVDDGNVAATLQRELRRKGRRVRVLHTDRWLASGKNSERPHETQGDLTALKALAVEAGKRRRSAGPIVVSPPFANGLPDVTIAPDEIVIWEGDGARSLAAALSPRADAAEIGPAAGRPRAQMELATGGLAPDAARVLAARVLDDPMGAVLVLSDVELNS